MIADSCDVEIEPGGDARVDAESVRSVDAESVRMSIKSVDAMSVRKSQEVGQPRQVQRRLRGQWRSGQSPGEREAAAGSVGVQAHSST